MCDAVVWYCLRIAVVVYRNLVLLDTYYSIRSAGARLEFIVRELRIGFRKDVGNCLQGWVV